MSSISHSQQIHLYSHFVIAPKISDHIKQSSSMDIEYHISSTNPRLMEREAAKEENSMILTSLFSQVSSKNPTTEFEVFGILTYQAFAIVIKKNSPFDTFEQLAVHARKINRPILLGGTMTNSLCDHAGNILSAKYGIPITHVTYKSGIESTADVLLDRIDIRCSFGKDIIDTVVVSEQLKILGSFSRFTDGPLKNSIVILPIDNAQIMLVNKKMKPEVRQKLKDVITSKIFKDSLYSLEKTNLIYLRAAFDESEILNETKFILKDYGYRHE
jgi:hypothetical protein